MVFARIVVRVIINMNKKNKRLKSKAFCGDGLLKYCIGKIFLIDSKGNNEFTSRLVSNLILSKIVIKNPHIFGEQLAWSKSGVHRLGTVYEAYLFDLHEKFGMKKCVDFVLKTYEITTRDAYEIYGDWMSYEMPELNEK